MKLAKAREGYRQMHGDDGVYEVAHGLGHHDDGFGDGEESLRCHSRHHDWNFSMRSHARDGCGSGLENLDLKKLGKD